jgi:hypothetical protein
MKAEVEIILGITCTILKTKDYYEYYTINWSNLTYFLIKIMAMYSRHVNFIYPSFSSDIPLLFVFTRVSLSIRIQSCFLCLRFNLFKRIVCSEQLSFV